MRKTFTFLTLLAGLAIGTLHADAQNKKALQNRANKAFEAASALGDSKACEGTKDNVALQACTEKEAKQAQALYDSAIKNLGTLLRNKATDKTARLPFEDGEDAWLKYRQTACDAVMKGFEGGSGGPAAYSACLSTITVGHMDELEALYEDDLK